MTQKQIIILAVLGVIFAGSLYFFVFRESDMDRQYRENMAKDAASAAAAPAAPAAGSPAAPAGAAAAAGPIATRGSRFESDTVNVDELLASVKVVDFDYDKEKPSRDPMAPLVGGASKKSSAAVGAAPGVPEKGPDPALIQSAKAMKVSGIMWNEKEPLAVVDNTVVGPGYAFPNGVSVDSITKTQVILKVQNQTIPIELKEQ